MACSFFGAVVLPDSTPSQTCIPHRLRITQASLGDGVAKLPKGERIVGAFRRFLMVLTCSYGSHSHDGVDMSKDPGIRLKISPCKKHTHDTNVPVLCSLGDTETKRATWSSRRCQVHRLHAGGKWTSVSFENVLQALII
jgi:hypothetical protein